MSARILAAFCLCNLVVLPVWSSSAEPPDSEVVVYLSGANLQPQHPLTYMKLEAGRLMGLAGYRVVWSDSRDPERPSTESPLAVVELRGTCAATTLPSAKVGALASTAMSQGRIIPFSSVDCDSLTRVLAGALAGEPGARRNFLYGRAMARLVAHELYHILAKTTDHGREGIARAGFSSRDLLTERFEFEESTLSKLRPAQGLRPAGDAGDDSGGR